MIFPRAPKSVGVSLLTLGVMGLSLLISAPAWAQVSGATLSGTVTDASGAIIPEAQISVKNVATGISTAVTANAVGFYAAPNLLPGSYEMTATAPGFATEVRSGITLEVGAQQVLNFTLKVGQTTEKVEVTGQAPTVELASSSISAVVGASTIVELPLNGRSWTDLAALQPGVNALTMIQQDPTTNARGNRGYGGEMTISGARPQQNNYRLDGISLNDHGNEGPGSVLGGNLGVDAIEEFSVLTSNYSAEYGRSAGGVINAITRSGTNLFHGSAYEFLRNSALDAANFFENSTNSTKAAFERNQFGGSAGGPIRKDRTFVFGDYEGIRQSKGLPVLDIVPSDSARQGNLCSVPGTPAACTPTTVLVDASAQKYLALYPHANAGPAGDNGTRGSILIRLTRSLKKTS
jgi:Carboxypeptidase regulatory-like domain/TonB-dependent Receptor Plug Domain